jgi:hypothetical protein
LPPLESNRADIELRIIRKHRSNTGHHSRAPRTPALHVIAGMLTSYPLTCPVRQRSAPVQTHRKFDAHPGQTVLHPLHETDVDFSGLRLHQARFDSNPRAQQSIGTLATYARVGILYGEDNACDTRFNQGVYAGRSTTVVAAGFESDVCSCTRNWLLGGAKGCHLRMRLPGPLMPSFRNDPLTFCNDTANPGIWMSCLEAPLGERQCARHCNSVEFAEHGFLAATCHC